ncbi:MAG: hypothetical protein HYT80_01520 [Euryarchaeota archaeon]|nr:hypothetical protein [Euryarchaeota archaeon]
MADRPNVTVPIALLATAAATMHASLGLIVNLDLPQVGYGFAAMAAGFFLAGVALFFAHKAVGLLLNWIALGAAGIGATWAGTSSYVPRTVEPAFIITSVAAIALLWSAFYALNWWLGGNPSRFLVRMGLGFFVAAAANLAYIPMEIMDDVYLFIADDVISAAGLSLAGVFLVRYGRQKAPPAPKPPEK